MAPIARSASDFYLRTFGQLSYVCWWEGLFPTVIEGCDSKVSISDMPTFQDRSSDAAAGLARTMNLPETSVAMPIHPLG